MTQLNRYTFVVQNLDSEKIYEIHKILEPKRVTEPVSQNRGKRGETSYQRTILKEQFDALSAVKLGENIYSSVSPIGSYLVKHQEMLKEGDIFSLNVHEKTLDYRVISKKKFENTTDMRYFF